MANNKLIEAIHEALVQLTPAERIEAVGELNEVSYALKFYETAKESFQKCFNKAQELQGDLLDGKFPGIKQLEIMSYRENYLRKGFYLLVVDQKRKMCASTIDFGDPDNEKIMDQIKDFIKSRTA